MAVLNDWATDPDASHVAVTPDDAELEDLFRDLSANISKPGATDIVIDEVIHPDFIITSLMSPTAGTAAALDAHTLQWKIPELGVFANEGASLEFQVQHIGQTSGEVKINQSIDYSDNEGNVVVFPDPSVTVECGIVITPEPCPVPVNVTMGGCRDVLVQCIKFVLPEDLDVSGGNTNAMCNARNFKVRLIAHNIDTDYRCCEAVTTAP